MESNKVYWFANPLLGLLAVFNIALTIYCCTQFYAYLPTSDTWIQVDFLAKAAQGQLDMAALFEKHNGVHVIALPKLVYFLDMWLTRGSGVLTVVISFLAQLVSAGIFITVIKDAQTFETNEKIFIGLVSTIFLLSACQVESLLNPANLQWSLLVFSATLTAWFIFRAAQQKTVANVAGVLVGMVLATLTSASSLLIITPLCLLLLGKKNIIRALPIVLMIGVLAGITVLGIWFPENSFYLSLTLLENWLKFIVDFMAPPVERLDSTIASSFTGIFILAGLLKWINSESGSGPREIVFFEFLLWFSLVVIFAAGAVRSYTSTAFTFRFVNVGLLFSIAFVVLLYLQIRLHHHYRELLVMTVLAYLGLLGYVNYKEASAFGYGRNHVRLNQVAYALDVRDSFVVSALPGTIWEKQDYEFVQANKYKLKKNRIGIYSDAAYQQTGKTLISVMGNQPLHPCSLNIIKMRRLLPDQAAYKLTGEARAMDGEILSRVYFADQEGVIRGFAIPVLSSRDLWRSIQQGKHWSGFVNLDGAVHPQEVQVYAYSEKLICAPQTISLPSYQPFVKKEKNGA